MTRVYVFAMLLMPWASIVAQDVVTGDTSSTPSSPASQIDEQPLDQWDRDHWAYYPIQRPAVPSVSDLQWPRNVIDRFVLSKMEDESLRPNVAASRSTWLRRVCWDLTGLPPTVDQIQTLEDDTHPDAEERFVDSLLASPEFGEHLAQPWLDLARYADTDGYEHDKVRKDAWRYRDWVIDATNQDFAYDRFVQWQIAGDQVEPGNADAELATSFCLSGPDMPDINDQGERRHVLLNEITSTVASVILGLQFGCAQCHDHKYDAISQADFYRLQAFFGSSVKLQQNRSVSVLDSYANSPPTHLMVRGDWRRKGPQLQPRFPRLLNAKGDRPTESKPPRAELARWLTDRSNPITARVIVNRVWQHHFGKGITTSASDFGVMGESPTHPELLDYLADDLMANGWSLKRLHRMVVLSSVYRISSMPPPQQANRFDWDKSKKVDPDNQWLSRFPARRLNAEALRDGLLAVGDSLNGQMRGPGISPPLPDEMVKTLKSGQWKVSSDASQHYRRSIYIFARRNLRYPLFATFDRPTADQPCARRNQSTTAVQSLVLFNSDLMMDASDRLAHRVSEVSDDLTSQIAWLYQRLYSRQPSESESSDAKAFVSDEATLRDLCRAMLNSNEFLYID